MCAGAPGAVGRGHAEVVFDSEFRMHVALPPVAVIEAVELPDGALLVLHR